MNKKLICLISIFMAIFLLFLSSCSSIEEWKTVEIEGYGSIEVPKDWEASVIDGYMSFSSGEGGETKVKLVQYRNDKEVNDDFDSIEEFVWVEDENFSNSAGISKNEVHYKDGSVSEMFILVFTGPNDYETTEFICPDSTVPEETLKKIANSFEMKE